MGFCEYVASVVTTSVTLLLVANVEDFAQVVAPSE